MKKLKPNRAQRHELYDKLSLDGRVTKGVIERRIKEKFSTSVKMNHECYREIYLLTHVWGEKPFNASLDTFFVQEDWDKTTFELWEFLSKLFLKD